MDDSLKILIVDDEEGMCRMLSTYLDKLGHTVEISSDGERTLNLLKRTTYDFVLLDVKMPGIGGFEILDFIQSLTNHPVVIMMSAYGTIDLAVEAMKKGAYDYISKPFKLDELTLVLRKAVEREKLKKENSTLKEILHNTDDFNTFSGMVGVSDSLKKIFEFSKKIAKFDSPVLITGESGVGKELIAKSIHRLSKGEDAPFVAINCGGVPENLLESEFFGYVKGAFTGADKNHIGLFESANGGTIFLDEIGEMPIGLQVKLLRVLQENEIHPIGALRPKKINVRVLSATHKDLKQLIDENKFREDLYYRLNVLSVHIPPLRERTDDILPLSKFFIYKFCQQFGKSEVKISHKVVDYLVTRSWNGNVRELKSAIEKALILSDSNVLQVSDFEDTLKRESLTDPALVMSVSSLKKGKRIVETYLIKKALKETNGNKTKAAEVLEISYPALLDKLKLYGV